MRARKLATHVVIALAILVVGMGATDGKISLRLNPEDGVVYETTTSVKTTTRTTIAATEATATWQMDTVLEMEFEPDVESGFTASTMIDSISLAMDGAAGEQAADLSATIASPMDGLLSWLEGGWFTITLSPTGQVTDVFGIDELAAELFEESDASDPSTGLVQEALRQQFGDDTMRRTMSQSFVPFPEGAIAVGASWSTRTAAFGVRMDSTYTLTDVAEGIATVAVTGTMELDTAYEPDGEAPAIVYEELHGSQEGTYLVDARTGVPLEVDIRQETTATIPTSLPGLPEEVAAQMTAISFSTTSTVHVETRKLD
jgi:hypothetical protein